LTSTCANGPPALLEADLPTRLMAVVSEGRDAVLQEFADWAEARAIRVGEKDGPGGVFLFGDLWLEGGRRPPGEVRSAVSVLRLALEAAEAEARYHALLDASFEAMCLHEDGTLVEANRALCELYGYTRDEMIGMHVGLLAAPEVLPRIARIVASGYAGAYETLAVCKDGSRVPLEARGKATVWHGRPVRVAAFRDLRDRKAVEAELVAAREAAEAASASKSQFLASMSHELRTPMNGVLGMVQVMLRDQLSPAQRRRAGLIRESADHLLQLINDVLDLSQVDSGQLAVRAEPTAVKPLLLGSLATVHAIAEAQGIALRVELSPALPARWVLDGLRIRQVLVNLLGNAARHTRSGHICLRVVEEPGGLRFEVEDTGEGMSADQQARLFVRYTPRDGPSRRTGGLGLSISRGLVERMGGEVGLRSAPGEGSTFWFRVPCRPVTQPQPDQPRVVVLHPDRHARSQLTSALRDRGVSVLSVAEEAGAGPVLRSFAPDLVYCWTVPTKEVMDGPWRLATHAPIDSHPCAEIVDSPVLVDDLMEVMMGEACVEGVRVSRPVQPRKVLVVDDNPVNRLVATELLQRAGHVVTEAQDGLEAVEACSGERFDLVLMDLQMPHLDGLSATRQLRSAGYTAPIYALTAHALLEDRSACEEAGMDGFITKPIRVDRLLDLLRGAGARDA